MIESVALPPCGAPRNFAIVERLESEVNGPLPHTVPPDAFAVTVWVPFEAGIPGQEGGGGGGGEAGTVTVTCPRVVPPVLLQSR